MEILVSHEQGREPVTVFHIGGRINLGNAKELQDKAEEAIQSGTRRLLLDLKGVESITSVGLRAIHSIYKSLSENSQEGSQERLKSEQVDQPTRTSSLKLLNPSPYVLKVLETAGFDLFLGIHYNLEEAIASF